MSKSLDILFISHYTIRDNYQFYLTLRMYNLKQNSLRKAIPLLVKNIPYIIEIEHEFGQKERPYAIQMIFDLYLYDADYLWFHETSLNTSFMKDKSIYDMSDFILSERGVTFCNVTRFFNNCSYQEAIKSILV